MVGRIALRLWFLILGSLPCLSAADSLERFRFEEPAMGTIFVIEVYARSRPAVQEAVQEAWSRVHALIAAFSDYDPNSELMRFCREPAGSRVALSPELQAILKLSGDLHRDSAGAFDVTIGPLKRLWRQSRRDAVLPSSERLAEARALVGWEKVELFADGTASLARDEMRLDLGGIAKGYAADEALAVLIRRGFPHALVAASGDVVAAEAPPGEPGWPVRAASLTAPETGDTVVHLRHQALSTSGDTQQSAEIDGKIYSHILDPKTGLGLTQRRMVNVLAPNSALADGWATALSIAGPTAVVLPSGIGFRYEEAALAPGTASTVVHRHWPGSTD